MVSGTYDLGIGTPNIAPKNWNTCYQWESRPRIQRPKPQHKSSAEEPQAQDPRFQKYLLCDLKNHMPINQLNMPKYW